MLGAGLLPDTLRAEANYSASATLQAQYRKHSSTGHYDHREAFSQGPDNITIKINAPLCSASYISSVIANLENKRSRMDAQKYGDIKHIILQFGRHKPITLPYGVVEVLNYKNDDLIICGNPEQAVSMYEGKIFLGGKALDKKTSGEIYNAIFDARQHLKKQGEEVPYPLKAPYRRGSNLALCGGKSSPQL